MENLQISLLVLQVIIALILIIIVLLQKSDGDSLSGIGGGSGGMNSLISKRTSANILSKTTMILVGVFMLNCLVLASLSNVKNNALKKDLEEAIKAEESINKGAPATEKNSTIPNVE